MCIPKAHKDSPSGAISPASPAHLTCAGKCREPASDERAPGPGSRASTSRWWPRLPGPPDVSEGRRPRSVPRSGHAGPRPGLSFRKRWQPGWPTWKGRKVMSHDLSPPGRPARPAGPARLAHLRPALGSTGPPARLFIRPELGPGAFARPGPHAPLEAPVTFPARPALPSQSRLLRATPPPGVLSGFSATPDAFPACLRRDLPFCRVVPPSRCACASQRVRPAHPGSRLASRRSAQSVAAQVELNPVER